MIGSSAAPLRPLGVGEVLDGAVRLARRNARSVLVVSVPYAMVVTLADALLQYVAINHSKDATTYVLVGTLIIAAGLGAVLTGLLAPLYSSDLLGNRVSIGASVRRVGWRSVPLFVLGLVLAISEGAGLVACIIGGVWLWGIWAVAAPTFALERVGIRKALGRSRALVSGTFWRVWGIRALGWFVTYVLMQLIQLPFVALAAKVTHVDLLDSNPQTTNAALYVAIISAGQLIAAALLAPVTSAIEVLLYTDLRMRKEGMDIVLGLRADPTPAPASPPAVSAW
jgi:hypothetical protein